MVHVLCGALGFPARAKELLVGVYFLIKDGEPRQGSGLRGHFRPFLGLLGAGESQTKLKVKMFPDSPASQPRWPGQTHASAEWALACVQEELSKDRTLEVVRPCYWTGNLCCGGVREEQMGVQTTRPTARCLPALHSGLRSA